MSEETLRRVTKYEKTSKKVSNSIVYVFRKTCILYINENPEKAILLPPGVSGTLMSALSNLTMLR